jgi:histone H3/H4
MARTKHSKAAAAKMPRTKAPKLEKTKVKTDAPVVKTRRYHPGTVARRDIRKLQKGTNLLIQKSPFRKLVRRLAADIVPDHSIRFQKSAIIALQEYVEARVISILADTKLIVSHSKRITIYDKDIRLTELVRRCYD